MNLMGITAWMLRNSHKIAMGNQMLGIVNHGLRIGCQAMGNNDHRHQVSSHLAQGLIEKDLKRLR